MGFNQQEYLNEYLKEKYFKPTIRIPKEKKEILDAVALKTGKSINQLFIEAFEKQYNVNLSKDVDWERFTEELKKINNINK